MANEVADSLRSFDCTLALDDFGAGYSSLARLRQLPFSELKIDRSYAANCHVDRFNAGVCETIVELAGRFELNFARMFEWVKLGDILVGLLKGAVFGVVAFVIGLAAFPMWALRGEPEAITTPA